MALYLGIPAKNGIHWPSFPWWEVITDLQAWLRAASSTHRPVPVMTISAPRMMTVWDGLVYLIGDPTESVIARVGAPETGTSIAGQTSSLGGEMISEVYVNAIHGYTIAATVWHELLHNKFQNIYDIHRTPGNFTSASAPYDTGGPNAFDLKLMSAALTGPSKQFQGGF